MPPCLSPDEFIDLVDGTLPPARRVHVDACVRCRATADEVRQAWDAAAAVEVPEPSALFWPSINARVRGAIAGADGTRERAWWRWPLVVPAAMIAAAGIVAVTLSRPPVAPESPGEIAEAPAAGATAGAAGLDAGIAPLDDAGLALMMDLASELPDGAWDAFGVRALPSIEVAAAVLSDDEQRALAALLHAEVTRPKS